MALKVAKAPAYDEVNEIPELRAEDIPAKKEIFLKKFGRQTTLSDDDIVNVIAYAEDDQDDDDWALGMLEMEEGKIPSFASTDA